MVVRDKTSYQDDLIFFLQLVTMVKCSLRATHHIVPICTYHLSDGLQCSILFLSFSYYLSLIYSIEQLNFSAL